MKLLLLNVAKLNIFKIQGFLVRDALMETFNYRDTDR